MQSDHNSTSGKDVLKYMEESYQILGSLAKSCCITERSDRMQQTQKSFIRCIEGITNATSEYDLQLSLQALIECGSQIGQLHVSCCTQTRETMYQEIFKLLNAAHSNISTQLGLTH